MQVFGLCEAAGGGGGVQDKTGLDHRPEHRRSMETEAKANCRRFTLGGKIECRTGNFSWNV